MLSVEEEDMIPALFKASFAPIVSHFDAEAKEDKQRQEQLVASKY